jgi:hypothetical protein
MSIEEMIEELQKKFKEDLEKRLYQFLYERT